MSELQQLTIRRPDDFHVHFRTDSLLEAVVPETAQVFGRALVMPNTQPPISDYKSASNYRREILLQTEKLHFTPLMTIKLFDDGRTTPETIDELTQSDIVVAAKLYPAGVTTNSHDGVRDVRSLKSVFKAMEDRDLVLCIHGESPHSFCLDKEANFLVEVDWILENFPNLRVVLEQIS